MNIKLRKLTEEDKYRLAELSNNLKIWSKLRDMMPYPYSLDDAIRFIELKKDQEHDYVFAIDYNGQLCGMIGLHPQKDIYRLSLELGYWIGEPYWGKGLASKAVALILDFAFTIPDVNRVFAGALEHNIGSIKVLEKNGFKLEGIARKAVIKNDVIRDEWRYSILKEEFIPKHIKL